MKTIKCKECGKELSSKADICPNCGYRVKKRLFIIQLGIVFFGNNIVYYNTIHN